MNYRLQFTDQVDAQSYDEREYRPGSYGQALWEIEKDFLRAMVADFRRTHERIELLDFATGSGRILSYLESMVDTSVGIDVSPAMVARARLHAQRSRIICRDITAPGASIEGTYDLITAYRFILNAGPELRRHALHALRQRLRDGSSRIVFNNHGNLWSHKAVLFPLHAARRRGKQWTSGNYLTHRQIMSLMDSVGLRAERVHGCGVLSGRAARLLRPQRLVRWERALTASPLAWTGVNQTYVARLA